MNRERYRDIVRSFAGQRIVVLGDLMMDEYLWGRATRISPESPVIVVEVDSESSVPGGAANVVNNLLSLGASVSTIGIVWEDAAGCPLRSGSSGRARRAADGESKTGKRTKPGRRKRRTAESI